MNMRKVAIAVAVLGAGILLYRVLVPSDPVATGAVLAHVQVPDLPPVAREGEERFNQWCSSCHGPNAAGQDGIAPPLIHRIYEPNHHGDASFHLAAKNGVRAHHWQFGNMPPVEGITNAELDSIVVYIRELQRANGVY
ncbi:cbb3-type cytochrome c oxidase subunit III [Hoeflea halophila]|uniref:Cbb3-type cytochrome c oxidase subunit III n=1 Tax=Hoeflea halophila TaxID=714899 RepID=A0A286IC39_9HYPH|nr:c-type cytochrome [Hoeflea halophila]SOE17216.1 cbb3-type cytochrome c oxidase subunit III [Hoeflea halophila]